MNMLLEAFDRLAETPNAVARLRELVLQLAVQGRLVPQDPADLVEPQPARTPWIKDESMELYSIPATWQWRTLSQIADFNLGRTPPTKEHRFWDNDGIPWVSISDMVHYGTITDTTRKISRLARDDIFRTDPVPQGTILMSFKLTIGKMAILGCDAFHNEAIISIFPRSVVDKLYLFNLLPFFAKQATVNNAIKGATLNSEILRQLPVALRSARGQAPA